MNNTIDQTKAVLAKVIGCDASTLTPETTLAALGADSLDEVEFVMALENEFKIEISDDDGQNIRTVQDAADLVSALL